MIALLVAALIVWAVLVLVGVTVKGLLWLAIVASALFVITWVVGVLVRVGRRG